VKPSNLLVFGDQVKLADFSLSVQVSSTMGYHRRVGTANYCAPEVLQGWLSDRSDQYSLAVTYCHLRGGRLPFPEEAGPLDGAHVRAAPDLSMVSLPERTALSRALAAVPQDRWRSCAEFLTHLEQAVLSNRPVAVP
jgi:serine/threonine-protein kinase